MGCGEHPEADEGASMTPTALPLDTPLFSLPLSVRAKNVLHAYGLQTLGDIPRFSRRSLLAMHKMGRMTINEIQELLQDNDLDLAEEIPVQLLPVEVDLLTNRLRRLTDGDLLQLFDRLAPRLTALGWRQP